MSMPVIELDHVTKEFRLGQWLNVIHSYRHMRDRLQRAASRGRPPFRALDDVNLRIGHGEIVGIVGHNGAGKSTLLKLLSGITVPTRGKVTVRGNVAPLIEVGAGLIGAMTGRENVYLNGSILGMSRAEIAGKFDEIVEFAELEQFIDTPLKRYSSGMQMRLGFSVAASVESEVLLIDEALAVGDFAFQRKCLDRIDRMISAGDRTILIVGHNIRQIERLCSRVVMLERGSVIMDGKPANVCGAFLAATQVKVGEERLKHFGKPAADVVTGHLQVAHVGVEVSPLSAAEGVAPDRGALDVGVRVDVFEELADVEIVVGIHTPDLLYVTEMTSLRQRFSPTLGPGPHVVRCRIHGLNLRPGVYGVGLAVYDRGGQCLWRGNSLSPFAIETGEAVTGSSMTRGLIDMPCTWTIGEEG